MTITPSAQAVNSLRQAGLPVTYESLLAALQQQGMDDHAAEAEMAKLEHLPTVEAKTEIDASKPAVDVPNLITDMRIAECFAQQHRDKVRYWPEIKKWLVYDGRRWTTDTSGGAFPLVKEMVGKLYESARDITDENQRQTTLKGVVQLESHRRQQTVLEAASVVPDMIINSHQLDRDSLTLNCLNGTLDLTTGSLREHNPNDFITRLVNIEFDLQSTCPKFQAFLEKVLVRRSLIEYLQRFVGYSLTGKISEQVLLFMYGTGANGKSTLASIIEMLLGDFAATADSSLLMQRDRGNTSNDLAGLRGARLVKVSEFNDGERLAEATVKTLTGGDRIACRFLYGEYFEYTPQYKILLLGNYKPKVHGRDHGIWRRIHLLPFNVTIPETERDPTLVDKLKAERPGILAWAVRGCLQWQKIGLKPPAEVLEEVAAYRRSEDIFQGWLDECCVVGLQYSATAKELLQSFIDFSNWRNITTTKFGRLLADAGMEKKKIGTVFWHGLGLVNANSGQSGQLDTFSEKSREENCIGKFRENALNCPNYPENDEEVGDEDLQTITW